MLIYKNDDKTYVYIHIPKNGGKYIRRKIRENKKNKIVKAYWNVEKKIDLAHIPYVLKDKYIMNSDVEYSFFSHTRNPYHRLISAYFYKCPKKTVEDFRKFIKKELVRYNFNFTFSNNIVHYYPQYLFLCDEKKKLVPEIKLEKLEDTEKPKMYNINEYYTNETLAIVNRIYEKDFELFGYEKINITE